MPEGPLDDFFEEEFREKGNTDPGFAQWEASKNERLEERVVKTIMLAGGHGDLHKSMSWNRRQATGVAGVDFAMFFRAASFPAFLHCKHVPYLYKTTHEKIFKGLKQLTRTWATEADKTPTDWDGPVGLVFEWLHAGSPLKIIHNHNITHVDPAGVQVRWTEPSESKHVLVLESLKDYMANIHWSKKESS